MTSPAAKTRLSDLEPNDVKGALEVYRARAARGPVPPDLVSILIKLQDDPTELLKALAAAGETAKH
jgi:hypothetical protein